MYVALAVFRKLDLAAEGKIGQKNYLLQCNSNTGVGSRGEKHRLENRLRICLRISLRFPILEKVQK